MTDDRPAPSDRERKRMEWELEWAIKFTEAFRTSEEQGWRELRQRVQAEGLVIGDVAIGTLFSDDVNLWFGVLGTRDGRGFTFDLQFDRGAAMSPSGLIPSGCRVWSWTELASSLDYDSTRATADAVLNLPPGRS